MNFTLSEEQRELGTSVERYLAERYDHEAGWRDGASAGAWSQLAALGITAACLPEPYGGLGGGAVETMLLMQAFGRFLVMEPYLATVVLGAGVIRAAGDAARAAAILPALADGNVQLCLAYAEPQGRFDAKDVRTAAHRVPGGWRLDGVKAFALNAPQADTLIVSARVAGERRDRAGICLFLMPRGTPGLGVRAFRTQDGLEAGDLVLDGVTVPEDALLGRLGEAIEILEPVLDEACVAVCAMAVGAMEESLAITADYLRLRQQFGRRLAEFQALQHRLVDMHMALEETRSLVLAAAAALAEEEAPARRRAVAAAKIQAAQAALLIGQDAVQMHGGIGITAEHRIGRYYKRLLTCATLFGDAAHHTGRYELVTSAP